MGTGPRNHPGKGETSNNERRTQNAEFKERGLQSASTFAATERSSKVGRRNLVHPLPKGEGRGEGEQRAISSPRKSPAAAGQTRLEFSQRGLHWRPAAPGLLPTTAIQLDVAQPSRLRVLAASRRQNAHGARRPVNSQARTPALQTSKRPPNWSLGASLEIGCWNLELSTPAPLWP
jgi:hypothetical protein